MGSSLEIRFIFTGARIAAFRLKINNNWRGNLHRVGQSLIVYEVLKDSGLDMMSDVMVAEGFFNRPYTIR